MTITVLVTYEFGKTIRNKIVNFKEAANSVNSIYVDPHHKQIITGDLLIVENNELRETSKNIIF